VEGQRLDADRAVKEKPPVHSAAIPKPAPR
jgi:hypothetical protein